MMGSFFRFLLVGGTGFVIDAGLTHLLISQGINPLLARAPAILLAMVFTWLANRYFTYRVRNKRSVGEAVRYALSATSMALVNYLVYSVLVKNLMIWPVMAVALATALQVLLSFQLYRRFVFKSV